GLDRLEAQLVAMLSRRDQWLEGVSEHSDDEAAWVARIEAAMTKALAAEVAEVAAGLDDGFFDRIHDVAVRSRAQPDAQPEDWPTLGATHFLGPRIESAPAWKQAAALLAKKGELRTPRSNSDDVHGGDPTTKALLDGLLEEIAGLWRRRPRRARRVPRRAPACGGDPLARVPRASRSGLRAGCPRSGRCAASRRDARKPRRAHRAHSRRRVPGYERAAVRPAARPDVGMAARRRAHALSGRRSDAIDLPLPQGGSRAVPVGAP